MEPPAQNDAASSDVNAHSFKQRKCYRRRGEADDLEPVDRVGSEANEDATESLSLEELIAHHGQSQNGIRQQDDDTRSSAAHILRQRKAAKRRRGGIEFTNSSIKGGPNSAEPEDSDILKDKEEEKMQHIMTVVDRFAPQTGQVADVDKHM